MLGDLHDGYYLCGLDIDSSLNPDGSVCAWAVMFLEALSGTYGERSPSGRGIKYFFFVDSASIRVCLDLFAVEDGRFGRRITFGGPTKEDHPPGVEFYTSHRFFTLTGDFWPGSTDNIATIGLDTLGKLASLVQQLEGQKATGTHKTTTNRPRDTSSQRPRPTDGHGDGGTGRQLRPSAPRDKDRSEDF